MQAAGWVMKNLLLAGLALLAVSRPAPAAFPSRLDQYFTSVIKLTAEERTRLLAGAPVSRITDADPSKEVAVFGAIWIAAPMAKYVAVLQEIENFEKGPGFRATKKIGEPARPEDFAALSLPDDDVKDLQACKVGDCELKASADGLARLRRDVDWSKPDVKAQLERVLRVMAAEYVNSYRQGGNSELAVYRDKERPTFVANELREMISGMPELSDYLTDMRQFLLDYPKLATRPTQSFIYWQEAAFGLKPTIRISHVAIQEDPGATIVASKQLYSSHYFWTALELRALIPDPSRGPGFWFVNVNRSRSDGLTGFVGRIIRGKVRDGARKGMDAALLMTKEKLERR
jgi:hypothetical protein